MNSITYPKLILALLVQQQFRNEAGCVVAFTDKWTIHITRFIGYKEYKITLYT